MQQAVGQGAADQADAPVPHNRKLRRPTNALEVRVGADKVDYVVNGTVVHTMPKAGLKTDGIYGIRVNHLLEVHIDGFGVSK